MTKGRNDPPALYAPPDPRTTPPPTTIGPHDVEVAFRVSGQGDVLETQGVPDPVLAEALAYAATLMDIMGEQLGLDNFLAAEVEFTGGARCLARREDTGDLLALVPKRTARLDLLRHRMHLD